MLTETKKTLHTGMKWQRFLDNLGGIFFYATPHHGMNERLAYRSLVNSSAANEPLLRFLKLLSTEAARLHLQFEQMCRDYKWKIFSLGETHAVAGQRTLVVPEASSRLGNYISLASDHFSICQPRSKTCNKYLHLIDLIETVSKKHQDGGRKLQKLLEKVVGVEPLLNEVLKQLQEHAFLGFRGKGGVGKTTMAKLVFEHLCESGTFQYTCFMEDVKLNEGNKEEIKEKIWRKMRY